MAQLLQYLLIMFAYFAKKNLKYILDN